MEAKHYEVNVVYNSMVSDNYKEGFTGVSNDWANSCSYKGDTIKDCICKVLHDYGMDWDFVILPNGDVCAERTTDEDLCDLTQEETERWKAGKMKAYNYSIRFAVRTVEFVTADEITAATGIEEQ